MASGAKFQIISFNYYAGRILSFFTFKIKIKKLAYFDEHVRDKYLGTLHICINSEHKTG